MKRHLLIAQGLSLWLWLTGPLLWAAFSPLPAWVVALSGGMALLRALVTWRMWAERGGDDGVLLTTGDVLPLGWLLASHRLGQLDAGLSLFVTGYAVLYAFEPGLWISWFVFVVLKLVAGIRDAAAVSAVRAVVAGLDGDPSRVLANKAALRDPRMAAWAYLMQGDPSRAEQALAHLDPAGPITSGSDLLALLELRKGRSTLLRRILAIDTGDHLMARYRRAALLVHWDLARGTTESAELVRAAEADLPRRHRVQLEALRRRAAGEAVDLPQGIAWMEKVYPWLGTGASAVELEPVDTRAIVENLFAPPASDEPAPVRSPSKTMAIFPLEWMPVVPVDRRERPMVILALLLVFAGLYALVSPTRVWLLLLLVLPMGAMLAEYRLLRGDGVPLVTDEGRLAGLYLRAGSIRRFSVLRAARVPGLMCIVTVFSGLIGLELGGGAAAFAGPLGLLGLGVYTVPETWRRMHPLRFALGTDEAPVSLDPVLDGHAWVGLGHLLRRDVQAADASWARSAHPATATLRQMLRPAAYDPASLSLDANAPVCWLWRVGMCKVLGAHWHGRPELIEADLPMLKQVFGRYDDPASALLLRLARGEEAALVEALRALDRRP